jgi:HAD superfamily hydrolase (TIGR01509 family)
MFAAAVFDMDGVLIDSERVLLRVWTAVAAEFDIDLPQSEFVRMVGLGAAESNAILARVLGDEARVRELRRVAAERLRADDQHAPVFPLRPGALALLSRLRAAGVPLAVASSTRIAEVRRRLDRVGVLEAFAALAGGDEVERSKPDPGVFLLAASRLGLAAERCLAFEDSPHGQRAALAAGMGVVMVPDLVPVEPAQRERAHAVIDSLHAAEPLLASWFGDATTASNA